jgi:spore germination protein GerM
MRPERTAERGTVPRIALVLAAVLLLGACGVNENSRPQLIPKENLPPSLLVAGDNGTTAAATPLTETVKVFFVDRQSGQPRLAPTEREVTQPSDSHARIEALLKQRPSDAEVKAGVTSSIPSGVSVSAVRAMDGGVEIDLSDFLGVNGEELVIAFAQLVYTATEQKGVNTVQFAVAGKPINAIVADGQEKQLLSRSDYAPLRPQA